MTFGFAPSYCQVSYHTPRPTKELSLTGSMIHAQQTIWMGFSKYRRSHTAIIFIILMNEKSVPNSVCVENKTTKIRLSSCVHITFCTVTFRYLWMLTSYVTGGCCHISGVSEWYGFPLNTKTCETFMYITPSSTNYGWKNLMIKWSVVARSHDFTIKPNNRAFTFVNDP